MGRSQAPQLDRRSGGFRNQKPITITMKQGLYSNINAKRKRIAAGSGEKMNKVGSKKAPTAKDFRESAKTAKKK